MLFLPVFTNRGDRIRTYGLLLPKHPRQIAHIIQIFVDTGVKTSLKHSENGQIRANTAAKV